MECIQLYSDEKSRLGIDCGSVHERALSDIIETALTQRTTNALWNLLLLQLASVCSDSVGKGTELFLVYVVGIIVYGDFISVVRCR